LVLAISKNLIYETLVISLFIVVSIYHLNKETLMSSIQKKINLALIQIKSF